MTSDRYAVQYKLDYGDWTTVKVYISYYGGTDASPHLSYSGYTPETSMSFVSIPARANATVQLRVTKLDSKFQSSDRVSVRPSVKGIDAQLQADGAVQISRNTRGDFAGEQFLLWWSRGTDGGAVEALAFFLDPPYTRPTGNKVKIVTSPADLNGDLSVFDTLDFEGTIAISSTGNHAFTVPANIRSVFLGPGAWVQGKLRFNPRLEPAAAFQADPARWLYGPGVLDVSRFRYDRRICGSASDFPDEGLYALTSTGNPVLENLNIDGIIITDHNHAAAEGLINSTVNNVKTSAGIMKMQP